ncbi:FCD domain-containing protein, partial [Escherichia coli]|uniref:FCD domain-containing protein n=1 Tax=Escherichia coli TaxID=562 RepID=UPI0030186B34
NPRWKKLNYNYLHEKHFRLQWLEDHRAMFLALQQKDSELAREASWIHLENSKNELIKIFKQDASIRDFDDFFFAR